VVVIMVVVVQLKQFKILSETLKKPSISPNSYCFIFFKKKEK